MIVLLLYLNQRRQLSFQKNIEKLRTEYEKNLLNAQLEVHEQTLQHISREIHDNIGLSLTLAKLNLVGLQKNVPDSDTAKFNESFSLITKAIQDLSSISHGLNTNVVLANGLILALEEECQRINKTGIINVSFLVSGDSVYWDSQKELFLFRIAQEALNNIIKYAKASKASVILHYEKSEINLTISDNGCGIKQVGKQKIGSGLLNMESRAKLLNGKFTIDSNSNGTKISISIPIS